VTPIWAPLCGPAIFDPCQFLGSATCQQLCDGLAQPAQSACKAGCDLLKRGICEGEFKPNPKLLCNFAGWIVSEYLCTPTPDPWGGACDGCSGRVGPQCEQCCMALPADCPEFKKTRCALECPESDGTTIL
jgi:hypothetical protein